MDHSALAGILRDPKRAGLRGQWSEEGRLLICAMHHSSSHMQKTMGSHA